MHSVENYHLTFPSRAVNRHEVVLKAILSISPVGTFCWSGTSKKKRLSYKLIRWDYSRLN